MKEAFKEIFMEIKETLSCLNPWILGMFGVMTVALATMIALSLLL